MNCHPKTRTLCPVRRRFHQPDQVADERTTGFAALQPSLECRCGPTCPDLNDQAVAAVRDSHQQLFSTAARSDRIQPT